MTKQPEIQTDEQMPETPDPDVTLNDEETTEPVATPASEALYVVRESNALAEFEEKLAEKNIKLKEEKPDERT
jgi:hypothetical protein